MKHFQSLGLKDHVLENAAIEILDANTESVKIRAGRAEPDVLRGKH